MCVPRTEPIEDKPIIVDCTFLCYVCAKGNLDRVGGPKVQVIIPDPTLHQMFALWVEEGKASLKGGEAK